MRHWSSFIHVGSGFLLVCVILLFFFQNKIPTSFEYRTSQEPLLFEVDTPSLVFLPQTFNGNVYYLDEAYTHIFLLTDCAHMEEQTLCAQEIAALPENVQSASWSHDGSVLLLTDGQQYITRDVQTGMQKTHAIEAARIIWGYTAHELIAINTLSVEENRFRLQWYDTQEKKIVHEDILTLEEFDVLDELPDIIPFPNFQYWYAPPTQDGDSPFWWPSDVRTADERTPRTMQTQASPLSFNPSGKMLLFQQEDHTLENENPLSYHIYDTTSNSFSALPDVLSFASCFWHDTASLVCITPINEAYHSIFIYEENNDTVHPAGALPYFDYEHTTFISILEKGLIAGLSEPQQFLLIPKIP